MAPEKAVLTINEAVEFLQVHQVTLYRMLKAGRLPGAFRMGRVWRIDREGLNRFITEASLAKRKKGS
jgi:excisionase family DNA binding protein